MKYDLICDECGLPIHEPEHGIVEWTRTNTGPYAYIVREMRIVHHCTASPLMPYRTCHLNKILEYKLNKKSIAFRPLSYFMSIAGLERLVEFSRDPAFRDIDLVHIANRLGHGEYSRLLDIR